MNKKKISLAVLAACTTVLLSSCGGGSSSTETTTTIPTATPTPTPTSTTTTTIVTATPTPTPEPATPTVDVADRGEILIDNVTGLSWINDTVLESSGDGCVSPANVGPTEPVQATSRCIDQNYGGFNDWRAPTVAELSTLIQTAVTTNTPTKYLNAGCPALVGTDGFVRTENGLLDGAGSLNATVAAEFPTAAAGDVIGGSTLASLNGVPAGVRCVRDGTNAAPSARFIYGKATAADNNGRTLIDTMTNLEWINMTVLDDQGKGCVSPGAVGPTSPDSTPAGAPTASERCETQQGYAGHNDWRAPTAEELSTIIIATAAADDGAKLKYLVAGCPANISTSNYVRTENDGTNGNGPLNAAVAAAFPDVATGGELATQQSDMMGVPSGVRCVRDVTTP